MKKIIGLVAILTPFVVISGVGVSLVGWRALLAIPMTIALCLPIVIGMAILVEKI